MKKTIWNSFVIGIAIFVGGSALATQYTFSSGGGIITARANHTTTLLQNGKLLIAGGHVASGSPTGSSELYNPMSSTSAAATASMPNGVWLHTATLLQNGKVLAAGGVDGVGDRSNGGYIFDPGTETWSTTGSLRAARSQHTATLLPNGKVLIAGGISGTGSFLATAELYDPATGAWTATGSMSSPRVGHTATLLPSGKVLAAGGSNSSVILASAELYDPATGVWTAASSMSAPRRLHTGSLLPNGIVIVAGGSNTGGNLATAELYDPASGNWTTTGSMSVPRSNHTASVLPNGRLMVAGGTNGSDLATSQIYDPPSGTWTAGGNMTTARSAHTATMLPTGFVIFIGGGPNGTTAVELFDPTNPGALAIPNWDIVGIGHTATLLPNDQVIKIGGFWAHNGSTNFNIYSYLFNPVSRTWSANATPMPRAYHSATLLPNGKLLLAGGQTSAGSGYLSSCELYNFLDNQFQATGSFAFGAARSGHTATLLGDGKKVLVAGGVGPSGALATAQLYDVATGSWSLTGSMATARTGHKAALLFSGKVLVVGGSTAELYDPATGVWTGAGNLHADRGNSFSVASLPGRRVLVAGGQNSTDGYLASAEIYDENTGLWVLTGNMTQPLAGHTATLLPNGKVRVLGGRNGSQWYEIQQGGGTYDPATGRWDGPGGTGGRFCVNHTATLLPRGEILIVGGYEDRPDGEGNPYYPYAYVSSVSTPGLDYVAPDWQPIVNGRPPLFVGERMGLDGSRFRGVSQASGGNTQDSSTSYPLVQLRSMVNDRMVWLPLAPGYGWSATNFTSDVVPNFPLGPARVTIFVNGIPSDSRYINIATLNAVSRKLHNGVPYDIPLPFTGAPGIECRSAGVNNSYQVIFKFNVPVNVGNAVAYPWNGTAEIDGPPVKSADSREVTVNLKNVTPQCNANIALQGIVDATNPGNPSEAYDGVIPFNVLVGDTSADKSVNSADIAQTKSKSGQAVDTSNFRMDVTADGSINSADISLVKSKSGTAIP